MRRRNETEGMMLLHSHLTTEKDGRTNSLEKAPTVEERAVFHAGHVLQALVQLSRPAQGHRQVGPKYAC